MRLFRLLSTAVLGLALVMPAFASADNKVLMLDDIRTQQAEIREGAQAGTGRYKALSSNQRSELLAKQDRLLHTIEGKTTTDDLNETQKTEVFNTLEWIEAVVNNDDADERMVCQRRPILGSTRKERICKTQSQWDVERANARDTMIRSRTCPDCVGF